MTGTRQEEGRRGEKSASLRKESYRTAFLLLGQTQLALKRRPSGRPACFRNNRSPFEQAHGRPCSERHEDQRCLAHQLRGSTRRCRRQRRRRELCQGYPARQPVTSRQRRAICSWPATTWAASWSTFWCTAARSADIASSSRVRRSCRESHRFLTQLGQRRPRHHVDARGHPLKSPVFVQEPDQMNPSRRGRKGGEER